MKNLKVAGFILIMLFLSAASLISCEKSQNTVLAPVGPSLTAAEIKSLQFMREEEKLARDVYQVFYEKYKVNIFSNITSSEQTHMDAVLAVMQQYGVTDPASNQPGVFTNPDLQQLYNNLIAQGNVSLLEALKVGATIEDVDIRDLNAAIAGTNNSDLINMYERLNCASGNHMRAFSSNLEMQGATYTPQFISVNEYEAIIKAGHQRCGMM